MRLRRRRHLSGDREVWAAYVDALALVDDWYPDRFDPRRPSALHELLDQQGTDVVDALRARRALRRRSADR